MRSSLAEVSHVSNVETDCTNRVCSFEADLDKVDVSIRLHELALDNDKLKGWSLATMEAVVTEEAPADSFGDEAASEEGGTENAATTSSEEGDA